jgi:hypothetical protein
MLIGISFQERKKRSFGHPFAQKADRGHVGDAEKGHDVWVTKAFPCDDFITEGLPFAISTMYRNGMEDGRFVPGAYHPRGAS